MQVDGGWPAVFMPGRILCLSQSMARSHARGRAQVQEDMPQMRKLPDASIVSKMSRRIVTTRHREICRMDLHRLFGGFGYCVMMCGSEAQSRARYTWHFKDVCQACLCPSILGLPARSTVFAKRASDGSAIRARYNKCNAKCRCSRCRGSCCAINSLLNGVAPGKVSAAQQKL